MSIAQVGHGASDAWLKIRAGRRLLFWLGLALIALGAGAIAAPRTGQLVVGAFGGWLLWLAGALTLGVTLVLLKGAAYWGGLMTSALAIGSGMFLFFNPDVGAVAVALLAAAVFVVDGAFQIALAFDLRPVKVWRWILASAIASLLAALASGTGLHIQSSALLGVILGLAVMTTGVAFVLVSRAAARI